MLKVISESEIFNGVAVSRIGIIMSSRRFMINIYGPLPAMMSGPSRLVIN